MIRLLLRLWPGRQFLPQRTRRTRRLGSPIWPQQPGRRSGTPDGSLIRTSFDDIRKTERKPLPRRNSPLVVPWTPILITLLFATASGTKIVFEEIGHMAGALSYQHVVIPLNLSSLSHQANSLEGVIQFYEDRIRDAYDQAPAAESVYKPSAANDYARINGLLNTVNLAGQYNITSTHRQNLKSVRSRIRDLRELFPNVDSTPEENARQINRLRRFIDAFDAQDRRLLKRSVKNRHIRRVRRQRRFVFQLVNLISGIWGTYNGIYTRQQLDQLRRDLSKVEEQQDRLFSVTSAHQTAILQLDTAVSAILDSTLRHTANPSSVTDVTLQRLVDMLERNVGKAQHAIQAAQLRRLSVDFLEKVHS